MSETDSEKHVKVPLTKLLCQSMLFLRLSDRHSDRLTSRDRSNVILQFRERPDLPPRAGCQICGNFGLRCVFIEVRSLWHNNKGMHCKPRKHTHTLGLLSEAMESMSSFWRFQSKARKILRILVIPLLFEKSAPSLFTSSPKKNRSAWS